MLIPQQGLATGTIRVPIYDVLACWDPLRFVASLMQPPVGAIDGRITSVREDFARDAYEITWAARYPLGQLSMGL